LPEDSPFTWQSVPSNRDARSPVPFVESESEESEIGSPIPSHKSPPGTPFFEAHTSLSPFLDDDRVLVLGSAQPHHNIKLESYEDDDSASDLSSAFGGTKSQFFCRICKADTCVDITTTTCGHLFCYECIAQRVVETSRCPICNNIILLYCLFKIDLSC